MPTTFIFLFTAIMLIACAFFTRLFLRVSYENRHHKAIWYKGAASICFVLTGIIMAFYCRDSGYALLVVLGLILGFIGDEILVFRRIYPKRWKTFYISGILAFALGHVFYLLAIIKKESSIFGFAVPYTIVMLIAVAIYTTVNKVKAKTPTSIPGYIYIFLVAFMGSAAFAFAVKDFSIGSLFFAIGGFFFLVSDSMLSVYMFGRDKRFILNILLHILYYAAQMLIAISLYFI